jgi:hypothetical protein
MSNVQLHMVMTRATCRHAMLLLQVGSCPTARELQDVAAHLQQHRGCCEAVAAPWLYACNDARQAADADDFLLPAEALTSVTRYQQARVNSVAGPVGSRADCGILDVVAASAGYS